MELPAAHVLVIDGGLPKYPFEEPEQLSTRPAYGKL